MKMCVNDEIYWWEGSGRGSISEKEEAQLKTESFTIRSGKIDEVDEENQRYWVIDNQTQRRIEMDDVSGHASKKDATDAANSFWGNFL